MNVFCPRCETTVPEITTTLIESGRCPTCGGQVYLGEVPASSRVGVLCEMMFEPGCNVAVFHVGAGTSEEQGGSADSLTGGLAAGEGGQLPSLPDLLAGGAATAEDSTPLRVMDGEASALYRARSSARSFRAFVSSLVLALGLVVVGGALYHYRTKVAGFCAAKLITPEEASLLERSESPRVRAWLRFEEGYRFFLREEYTQAVEAFEGAIELHGELHRGYRALGITQAKLGKPKEARAAYLIYSRQGELKEDIEMVKRFLELPGGD
ncbi:MAG: hypothetical protein VX699_05365 [Myxococcota bacterium]|nr:hypothetical protein [Myxococcota bacterium]